MYCILVWGLMEGLIKGTLFDKMTEQAIKSHLNGCKTCNFVMSRLYAHLKLTTLESLEKTERLRKGKVEQGHLTALEIVEVIYRSSIPDDLSKDPVYEHLSSCEEGCSEMFMKIVKEAQRLETYFANNPAGCIAQEARWWRMSRM